MDRTTEHAPDLRLESGSDNGNGENGNSGMMDRVAEHVERTAAEVRAEHVAALPAVAQDNTLWWILGGVAVAIVALLLVWYFTPPRAAVAGTKPAAV